MSSIVSRIPGDVTEVVRAGLCTGCGLCASMAGTAQIRMGLNAEGFMRPSIVGDLDPAISDQIMQVCPGAQVTGPGSESGPVDTTWGPVRELMRTWSAEPEVRHRAAAGGTLTALGRYLLAKGEVDAVVHVNASREVPWLTDSVISTTPDEVLDASQSRYGPAAPLVHVNRLLNEGKRFAVIAKPCDISAVRALAKIDARVGEQVPYLLTIFCGGVHHAEVPKSIIAHHGVPSSEVSLFRYRGNGWPGPTRVEAKSGERFDLSYREAWLEPAPWRYDMQFRCKICPDAIGEAADVSAPDGWVLRDGQPIYEEAPGVNATLARTEGGKHLLEKAVDAGFLERSSLCREELDRMHLNHKPRKLGWPAAQFALLIQRQPRLRVKGYRLFRTVAAAGPRLMLQQLGGTLMRIRRGDNRESSGEATSLAAANPRI